MKTYITQLLVCVIPVFGFAQQWVPIQGTFGGGHFYFLDADNGYGFGQKIRKTTDGGLTQFEWNPDIEIGVDLDIWEMHFPDPDTGYAIGIVHNSNPEIPYVLKTVDEGYNWSVLSIPSNVLGMSVFFANTQTGFIGGRGGLYKTTNGGANWTFYQVSSPGGVVCLHFIDGSTGYAGTNYGYLYKTTNCGQSWNPILIPGVTNTAGIWDIDFLNASKGFITTGTIEAFKTNDAGITWIPMEVGFAQKRIAFINQDTGFITAQGLGVHYTVDGGINWSATNITTYSDGLYSPDPNTIYSSGSGVPFSKWVWLTTGEQVELTRDPSIAVWPNPAWDCIHLSIDNEETFSRVELFTLSGSLIFSAKYRNSMTLDISNIAPGIYLLKLIGERDISLKRVVKYPYSFE